MDAARIDGRTPSQLRPVSFERCVNRYAEGSCLVRWGNTQVLCTATVEEKVPPFMRGEGRGWVTAEYSMLPRATKERNQRDVNRGKVNGRGCEIQRLVGRSLRAAVDMAKLGERTITIDCDVLQADGGTRTASISAGFVALFDAFRLLKTNGLTEEIPLRTQIGAVSVGKVRGVPMLDLCYEEDSTAEVDANLVMTGEGNFVELQGTGEGGTFSRGELEEIIELGWAGVSRIHELQRACLELTPAELSLFSAK
jgi:ribonuclease PH